MSATYSEAHAKEDGLVMFRGRDGCVIKQVQENGNYRLRMMGMWVFTIQLFKPFSVCEIVHNKVVGVIGDPLAPVTPTLLPLPNLIYIPG